MSQTTLNLVAITIFSLVMASLLGPLLHLSPVVPAAVAFGLLSLTTINAFGQGQMGTLLIDWFARFSPEHRDRVIRHEAGHFLVAHLLDIPVTGYTLSAWEAFRQGQPGQGGVSVDSRDLETGLVQGIPDLLLDRYCTVWMAGIAAETLVYGEATGGADDRQTFRQFWGQLQRSDAEGAQKERWASLQAKNLIQTHWQAYEALIAAMEEHAPVESCRQAIEQLPNPVEVEAG